MSNDSDTNGTEHLAPAARAILDSMRALYTRPVTMVAAREDGFRHLGLRAYANARAGLEARGFRYLGDVEITDVTNAPGSLVARTMLRVMVSADGCVLALYYQCRPRITRVLRQLLTGLANLRWIDAPRSAVNALTPREVVDLETELSDGSFVITSNAEAAGQLGRPPTVDTVFFPFGTAADVLLREQERRLRSRLENDPSRPVVAVSTLEQALQMGLRLHAQKCAYRASLQWVSRAELRAMSSNAELADQLYEEVQKQLREQG